MLAELEDDDEMPDEDENDDDENEDDEEYEEVMVSRNLLSFMVNNYKSLPLLNTTKYFSSIYFVIFDVYCHLCKNNIVIIKTITQ